METTKCEVCLRIMKTKLVVSSTMRLTKVCPSCEQTLKLMEKKRGR